MRRARLTCSLLLAAALALSLAACGHASGPAVLNGKGWRVATDSFRLTFVAGGRAVATEAPGVGSVGDRLGYATDDGATHGLGRVLGSRTVSGGSEYYVATNEKGRTAYVTVRRRGGGVDVSLRLAPATQVVRTFEAFTAGATEHYLGGGERPGALDLRGQVVDLKTANACDRTKVAPFFVSSAGYGVALHGDPIGAIAFPGGDPASACAGGGEPLCPVVKSVDEVQLCAKTPTLAYRLFTGSPARIVTAYARLAGRPLAPQPSQFELIKWRDEVAGPQDLTTDVDKLHALGIPIGWVLLDNPWESGLCYGNLAFDAQRFPDPAGMIRTLHGKGVKLMLWISPLVRRQWCPLPSQYPKSALVDQGGSAATLDLTDPAVVKTFEDGVAKLVRLGVDGFKGDRGDEFDLESTALAHAPGATVQNTYPLLYERAVAAAIRAAGKPRSFPTIFRAGSPGSASTVSGFWGGDQPGSWDGLVQAVHGGLSGGTEGYSTWGSDTGGYASSDPPLPADVFVRWAQFSAVCPVFEVGGTGPNATFWSFGAQTVARFRDAAVLHYELFPYLYGLAREAHRDGLPVLRPLALSYPDQDGSWAYDTEALVGPSLLAAPVTKPGTNPVVFVPPGSWTDLATGRSVAGPQALARPTPLSQLPLYLEDGSAIPFAARTPAIWPRPWPTDALTLAGRGGWLYAPGDGRTAASDPSFGRFAATRSGGTVTLSVARAPRETQVLVATDAAPRRVAIAGRTLPQATSEAALRGEATGWLRVSAPFRGIVLKLAPAHGAASVRLTLR